MLQEHSLGGISVCALLKEALVSRASTQGFLEGTAIIRKKMQKEKKMTHQKTRHIQDRQLNTYLVKLVELLHISTITAVCSAFSLWRVETQSCFKGKSLKLKL